MIAKKHRFHGHRSVSRVRGHSLHLPYFKVFYAYNDKRTDYRMAVVVSKKIAKSAVVRNRIRRRLYESVRVSQALSGKSVDCVFVVSNVALAELAQTELDLQIAKVASKITER